MASCLQKIPNISYWLQCLSASDKDKPVCLGACQAMHANGMAKRFIVPLPYQMSLASYLQREGGRGVSPLSCTPSQPIRNTCYITVSHHRAQSATSCIMLCRFQWRGHGLLLPTPIRIFKWGLRKAPVRSLSESLPP